MALNINNIFGKEISTEKYVVRVLETLPATYTSVQLTININTTSNTFVLEHLPILGTNDTYDFEINSIVKDYFDGDFLPLTGANQTAINNAIVDLKFNEVTPAGVVNPFSYSLSPVIIKNITQDTFEIEDFNLADYDCGDAGSITSKLLTSSPDPLPIGDLTSVHVSCLTTSYTGGVTPKQEWFIQTLLNGVLVATTNEAVNVPDRSIPALVAAGKYDISTYRFDFDSSTGIDEVRFYVRDIASPFTARSETKVYKLRDDCEKTITLSWLNEFNAQDSYTFAGNINRVGKYTDSTFKRVRPVNPVSADVGDLVYKSSYNYEYDLFSDRIPENHVEWLSKMLINKRAAIQESPSYISTANYLYNFFTLNNGVSGDGRVSGGIVNNTVPSWALPSQADFATLSTFLGGDFLAGGEMKETGLVNWNAPNTGATNNSGFTALGQGNRNNATGNFSGEKSIWNCWSYDTGGGGENGRGLNLGTAQLSFFIADNKYGYSVRLVRPAVGGEVNGQVIPNAYIGNNNKSYDGVVIGTQVWINKDLQETKYNNGASIVNTKVDASWALLSTGSFCTYNNLVQIGQKGEKYFPIVITTEESTLEDKFSPETLFRIKFRLANERKGIK